MTFNLKTTCVKCTKEMEPQEMRAFEGGKKFICRDCFSSANKGPSELGGVKLRTPQESSQRTVSDSGKTFFEYKEWFCSSCKYQFKRSPEFLVNKCPFCAKEDTVSQKVDEPADELLKDWSEM